MSCPRFLKTLDLNDFLENLFDFFAFKVDVANIIWLSYEYSQKNIEKNNTTHKTKKLAHAGFLLI